MAWHTVEHSPEYFEIMDGDRKIGTIANIGTMWLIQIGPQRNVFSSYPGCLAYMQGVESMVPTPLPVTVTAGDYTYQGWIVSRFPKRKSGEIRYVVEDENGRLFIHNGKQIGAE